MRVYIVGDSGPEHNMVLSIHKIYGNAFKMWNAHRLVFRFIMITEKLV